MRPIAAVVRAVVVRAQDCLIAPDAEHHELARIVGGEHTEADAPRLGAAGVAQLREERAQLRHERNASVDIGHQHHLRGHLQPRV